MGTGVSALSTTERRYSRISSVILAEAVLEGLHRQCGEAADRPPPSSPAIPSARPQIVHFVARVHICARRHPHFPGVAVEHREGHAEQVRTAIVIALRL